MAVKQVVLGILGVGLVGGGVAGYLGFRGHQIAQAVAGLEQFQPPADWTKVARKGKGFLPVRTVAELGGGAIGPLRARVGGPEGVGRQGAIVALGELRADAAVPDLVGALRGTDAGDAGAAAYALSLYHETPEPVRALLDDATLPAAARPAVYRALALSRDKRSHKLVARGLTEADADIRLLAVQALSRMVSPESLASLVDALADADAAVGRTAVDGLVDRLRNKGDAEAAAKVRELATGSAGAARARALAVCARTFDAKAGEAARRALGDADPEVVAAAAQVVRVAELKDAVPALLKLLERPEPEVVDAAVEALKHLNQPGMDAALGALLGAPSAQARRAAAALVAFCEHLAIKKQMGSEPWKLAEAPFVPLLIECLGAGDAGLADAATSALRAFSARSNFKNEGAGAAAWQGWWAKVQAECTTVTRIRAELLVAGEIVSEQRTADYTKAKHILEAAQTGYEELKEKGSVASYENGELGLKAVRNALVALRKTYREN